MCNVLATTSHFLLISLWHSFPPSLSLTVQDNVCTHSQDWLRRPAQSPASQTVILQKNFTTVSHVPGKYAEFPRAGHSVDKTGVLKGLWHMEEG